MGHHSLLPYRFRHTKQPPKQRTIYRLMNYTENQPNKPYPSSSSHITSRPTNRRKRFLEPTLAAQVKEIRKLEAQNKTVCIDYIIKGSCTRSNCRFEHPKWDGHHLNCCVANLRGISCHRGQRCHFPHIEDGGEIVVPIDETSRERQPRTLRRDFFDRTSHRSARIMSGRTNAKGRGQYRGQWKPRRSNCKPADLHLSADDAPSWRDSSAVAT